MTRYTYRTSEGIEQAVKKGIKIIRVEDDSLFSAMCSLAAYSDGCVDTFTVKPIFLDSGLVFDVSIQKMLSYSHTLQTTPDCILAEKTDFFSPDYVPPVDAEMAGRRGAEVGTLAYALALYPNYISFRCGHKIEATVSDIEGLDDGVDLSLCPTCKRAQEAEDIQEAAEVKLNQEKQKELYLKNDSW